MPLAIIAAAVLTATVSLALGSIILGEAESDPGLRFVTGAALLSFVVFIACSIGAVYIATFAIAAAIPIIATRRKLIPTGFSKLPRHRLFAAILAVYGVLYFFNAMVPDVSFDGSRYHLGLIERYLREHGFHQPVADNMYASLTQAVEMVYLFAYTFAAHHSVALVHFAFLLALAWMMCCYAMREGQPLVGACAALLVFVTPVVAVDVTTSYIDVAVAAIVFALFYVLQTWADRPSTRLLVAAGLLAGFAFAAKYTAWTAVPYCLAFVVWKSRRPRDVLIAASCAAFMIAPWLIKNWIWVHNPVAPFFNGVFHNPYFMTAFEREYGSHFTLYDLHSRWEIPFQITMGGRLDGILGPVFFLSPIALLSLSRPAGRRLLLAAAVFGSTYFSNIGTRFLIPVLPFLALAMMLSVAQYPHLSLALVAMHAILSWPSFARRYTGREAWLLAKVPYREALRIKPEESWLHSNLPLYDVARMVERNTPEGATIFAFTPIPEAYTSRNIRVVFQSAQNAIERFIFFSGFVPEHQPTLQLNFDVQRTTLRGLRIVQTAIGKDTWSIHELRIFDGGSQLSGQWHWTADPYPWGIGELHDGRPLTFWMSDDMLNPSQSVQVDFESALPVTRASIQTAPNQFTERLKLQGQDPSGAWRDLSASPATDIVAAPSDIRRAAASELKHRGIDYILIFRDEFGADDLAKNQELWGMHQVGAEGDARLYQLSPAPTRR